MNKFVSFVILFLCILTLTPQTQGTGQNINQNMYLYYTMDSINDGKVLDHSGNGRNAQVHGDPTVTTGVNNTSLSFNGKTDYLDTNLRFQPSGSFSISTWFKTSNTDSISRFIIQNDDYTTYGRGIEIGPYYQNSGNSFRCAVFGKDGGWYSSDNSSNRYADNQWHNVIMVFRSGLSVECYVDGNSLGKTSIPSTMTEIAPSTANLEIGSQTKSNIGYYHGLVDVVQIFNGALTTQEIQSINSEMTIPTSSGVITTKTATVFKVNNLNFDWNTAQNIILVLVLGILGVTGGLIVLELKKRSQRLESRNEIRHNTQNQSEKFVVKGTNFCKNCHSMIYPEDKYCQNCGAPILLLK